MAKQPVLAAQERTEFGKGAARRARRAGSVPAVVYGHGADPLHITVDTLAFLAIVRKDGVNAVIALEVAGDTKLALVKSIAQNPVTREIEHVDFLLVKKGEKVEVEVPLVVTGEPAPGAQTIIETDIIKVEADALSIPEEISISVEGLEAGTSVLAGDVELPDAASLQDDPEAVLVNIIFEEAADTESDLEAEEPAEVDEDTADDDAADSAEDSE